VLREASYDAYIIVLDLTLCKNFARETLCDYEDNSCFDEEVLLIENLPKKKRNKRKNGKKKNSQSSLND